MPLFAQAPKPKTVLGNLRILSPQAGVRVSPLCLGAMNFGDAWSEYMGKCDKKQTFEVLDFFHESGGNWIDTACNYQDGESETWIGEWMQSRGTRDQMVLATKFSTGYLTEQRDKYPIQGNFHGNSTKNLHHTVRDSLKKLQTDYIDILYVHWWDFSTSIPELMQSLNALVQRGVVLYLGISDAPAWIVSKANEYARNHGLRGFSVYQGRWSAASRDFERDIIPMCRDEGMAIAPWGSLGGGNFKTEEQRKLKDGRNMFPASEAQIKISKVLEKVANAKGTAITSIALAYVMHKTPNVFPIVGGRTVDHLKGNIEALKIKLSDDDMKEIEAGTDFDIGFPLNFLFGTPTPGVDLKTSEIYLVKAAAHLDIADGPKPVQPRSE